MGNFWHVKNWFRVGHNISWKLNFYTLGGFLFLSKPSRFFYKLALKKHDFVLSYLEKDLHSVIEDYKKRPEISSSVPEPHIIWTLWWQGEEKAPTLVKACIESMRRNSNGAKLIGANSDASGPIENGIAPACGALISPIEIATGKKAYFCGKPNPLMMRTGLRMLDCHSADAVMIGDRMDTDMISGLESGMSTVLVLSGVTTKEEAAKYAYQPSMILNGVGDIVKEAKKYK